MAKVTESGKFAVPGPYDMLMEWWLQMYPKRRTMEMKNFVAVYLKTEKNALPVRAPPKVPQRSTPKGQPLQVNPQRSPKELQ